MRRIAADVVVRCVAASLASVVARAPVNAQAPPPAACDSIQYRLVKPTSTLQLPPLQNHRTGEHFVLEDSVLLSARDIERIEMRPHRLGGDTVWSVFATLTPAAAHRFGDATASHVGDTIAVLIGDDIVETAMIESRLGGKVGIVDGVSKSLADSLLARASRLVSASCVGR